MKKIFWVRVIFNGSVGLGDFAPVSQIISKTCDFIVFKIHVKTVNRKSFMVHMCLPLCMDFCFHFYL